MRGGGSVLGLSLSGIITHIYGIWLNFDSITISETPPANISFLMVFAWSSYCVKLCTEDIRDLYDKILIM